MNQDDWKRLFELLDTFVDISPDRREAWLDKLQGEDRKLRDPLRKLIAQGPQMAAEGFLVKPAAKVVVTDETAPPLEPPPARPAAREPAATSMVARELSEHLGRFIGGVTDAEGLREAFRGYVQRNSKERDNVARWLQQSVASGRLPESIERSLRDILDETNLPGEARPAQPAAPADLPTHPPAASGDPSLLETPTISRFDVTGGPRYVERLSESAWEPPPQSSWQAAPPESARRAQPERAPQASLQPQRPQSPRGYSELPVSLAADDDVPPPRVGMVLGGHFKLVEELGAGGMGHVFKAEDRWAVEAKDRNPYVAVKVLNEEFKKHPDANIALQREVKRAHTLAHQNVIDVYQFERDGPYSYMTMEYLQGQPLDRLIATEFVGGISYERAWPIVQGICAALEYGHTKVYENKKGIVHSDLKPGNVFICKDGGVKLLDFGISRPMAASDADTMTDVTQFDPGEKLRALTLAYASLEMIQGKPPAPSDDIYALGCITYELLAGRHPFLNAEGRKSSAVDAMTAKLVPKRIESLNRTRWEALKRTLAFRREDRTASVAEFVRAFEPKSFVRQHAPAIAAATFATVAGVVAISAYYYRAYVEQSVGPLEMASRDVKLTPEQRQQINDYLGQARDNLSEAKASLPADDLSYILSTGANNVYEILRAALQIQPNNPEALAMRARIADLYAEKARQLVSANMLPQAMELVANGLKVKPSDRDLVLLQREICARDNNACTSMP
ncbi:MAG TPA: protein kinase [Steroidobacteraceae bacterium]|nr:protein kinase [Steroidobacteraceae bacterium]